MKSPYIILMLVLVACVVVLSACGGAATSSPDKPVPPEYAGKTNPYAGKADAVNSGKEIFASNCAACHGEGGKGDGPAGASLNPKPTNLAALAPSKQDDFLHWVISEGGFSAGKSASMVGWKGILSEDEIWQVITYIRTLK